MANKELYYFRKSLGLCVRCGKPKFKKITLCLDCRDQCNYINSEYRRKLDKEYYKKRYEKNKEYSKKNNLCIRCLKPRNSKYKICLKCREKIRFRRLKRR